MTIRSDGSRMSDARAAAMARTDRVFRWTVTGAATAFAVIFGVVAHELPGHAPAATTSPASSPVGAPSAPTAPATSGATAAPGDDAQGSVTPSPPVTAPAPTQRAPVAVSGATGW